MKKYFSFFMMAIMALSTCTLASCGKDDDDNTGGAVTADKSTHSCYATVSNDIAELFDIYLTRTAGTDVNVMKFTNDNTGKTGKMTDVDKFTTDKSTDVTIVASVTLKSNWEDIVKERAAKGDDATFELWVKTDYTLVTVNSSSTHVSNGSREMSIKASKLTKEQLERFATSIALELKGSNAN